MPPSQLKRLKASLREQGIVGPHKSKKQKKQNVQSAANDEKRVHRRVVLNGIRENFNPFEFKTSARGPKFDVTSVSGRVPKARPGIKKGLGEETRRKTLLVEMQRRNKVGGITDRRFGEDDPSMAPEDKMLERFTQEKQRRHKNSTTFDLEDEGEEALTHMGQSLSLRSPALADDFDEEGLGLSDADDHPSNNEHSSLKRRRVTQSEELDDGELDSAEQPERKKTKQEVMQEVIAKSKLHKYERQAAKDEDDDLREELDKELADLRILLQKGPPRPISNALDVQGMNPERVALLYGTDKSNFDKEYDLRLRQLALDKKSIPTERTKTEEEILVEESRKLQELEARRLRRMRGEPENEDYEEEEEEEIDGPKPYVEDELDEGEDFGLGAGIKARQSTTELNVEDEDEFVIEDNLVANGSDIELSDEDGLSENGHGVPLEDDSEFIEGLLTEEEFERLEFLPGVTNSVSEVAIPASNGVNDDLAYTFPCPLSHAELLDILKNVVVQDLPIVIRRIRALYHPKLKSENKGKLGKFTLAIIDHVSYLTNQSPFPPFEILENVIRHIHSLAKSFPVETANSFRNHLKDQTDLRPLAPTSGDLVLLVGIGTIFPTSDHFHQVVTPAMLCMARYIGQKIPHTLSEYTTGVFLATLSLQYQKLSRRYVPEIMGFLVNTLYALAPKLPLKLPRNFAYHESKLPRLKAARSVIVRKLAFSDTMNRDLDHGDDNALKAALMQTCVELIDGATETWIGKTAFGDIFEPALSMLRHLGSSICRTELPESIENSVLKTSQKLERLLKHAHIARRPLELHHHRPLAIKTSIPKFEESFNPDKHYDPNRERAEVSKLRAEHKRERKGAIRELRKDAQFIARESLREKKEKDAAYEKKYKRLVAEIQGEEGKEAKAYEREKEARKKAKR